MEKQVKCPLCKVESNIDDAEGQNTHRCPACRNLVRLVECNIEKKEIIKEEKAVKKAKKKRSKKKKADEK